MTAADDPRCNHLEIYHGPLCPPQSGCTAEPGALLLKVWHKGAAASDMEWQVTMRRVDDPQDHVGSCYRWGPDVTAQRYPAAPLPLVDSDWGDRGAQTMPADTQQGPIRLEGDNIVGPWRYMGRR